MKDLRQAMSLLGGGKGSKPKPKGQKRRAGNSVASRAGNATGVATNLLHHAMSSMNPGNYTLEPKGLVVAPFSDSLPARATVQLDVTCGSTGLGAISINPTTANDSAAIVYSSGSTYVTATVPESGAPPVGSTTATMAALPFATGALVAPALEARVVGLDVEFWSTSTLTTMGGTAYICPGRDNQNIGNLTAAQLSALNTTVIDNVGPNKRYHTHITPNAYAFTSYSDNTNYFGGSSTYGSAYLAVLFVCQPGATFHVKVTAIVEYSGYSVQALSKPKTLLPAGAGELILAVHDKVREFHAGNPLASKAHKAECFVREFNKVSPIKIPSPRALFNQGMDMLSQTAVAAFA